MPKNYKVKENESLMKIAKDNGFIGIDPLVQANDEQWPYLSLHPHALIEGMIIMIPDKQEKKVDQGTGTDVIYTAKKSEKQFFSLKIEDHLGEIISVKNHIHLYIKGSPCEIIDKTNYDIKPVKFKEFTTTNPLPDGDLSNSYLEIEVTSVINGKVSKQKIDLEIGGIDPFIDPGSIGYNYTPSKNVAIKKAAQKLLMNLGCYSGDLDGDLDKPDSVAALIRFQERYMQMNFADEEYGKPGQRTCASMSVFQGVFLGPTQPIKYD